MDALAGAIVYGICEEYFGKGKLYSAVVTHSVLASRALQNCTIFPKDPSSMPLVRSSLYLMARRLCKEKFGKTLISNLFKQRSDSLKLILVTEFGFEMASVREIITSMLHFYHSRKGHMILFLTSSVLNHGPDCEKEVFANLLYKFMADTLTKMEQQDLIDACFHFEMLLLYLIRTQRLTQKGNATNPWLRHLEDIVEHLTDEELEDDIREFEGSRSLKTIKDEISQKTLGSIMAHVVRASYEQGPNNVIETILLFCQKTHDSIRSLYRSWNNMNSRTIKSIVTKLYRLLWMLIQSLMKKMPKWSNHCQ